MVPGSVFSRAQNAEEKAEMLETGRLLNINEKVTSSYVLADKGGAALENLGRDGRAMRVRKRDLVAPRGHIGTRESGSRCLGETPQFAIEATSLQSISCASMCPTAPKKEQKTDMQYIYSQEPPDSNRRDLVRSCTDDEVVDGIRKRGNK